MSVAAKLTANSTESSYVPSDLCVLPLFLSNTL